jgi:hypothetical protein
MEGENTMKHKMLAMLSIVALLATFLAATPVSAGKGDEVSLPIAVTIDHRLKNMPAPAQPSPEEAAAIAASSETTESQCFGDNSTLVISISSFDPANPGEQDVVFFKETPAGSTGKATLWVAWDFLATAYGRQDTITCDQLAYLQGAMDSIVGTDVYYFGDYVQRPAGNENIDVMIYNIVDESYYDVDFPFFIAGFFWSKVNEQFDRNMIFIDTYDWVNRLGPDALHPYDYEGTVAHELQHLIHNDHDPNEASWVVPQLRGAPGQPRSLLSGLPSDLFDQLGWWIRRLRRQLPLPALSAGKLWHQDGRKVGFCLDAGVG